MFWYVVDATSSLGLLKGAVEPDVLQHFALKLIKPFIGNFISTVREVNNARLQNRLKLLPQM